jgi:hypothetical protein
VDESFYSFRRSLLGGLSHLQVLPVLNALQPK